MPSVATTDDVVQPLAVRTDLLHHACGLGLLAYEDDPKVAKPLKRKLANNMRGIIKEYQELWLARNREGGLMDSVARLENILKVYK